MKRWPIIYLVCVGGGPVIVLVVALALASLFACAPTTPDCTGPFCYDAANDLIHVDDAYLSIVGEQYGQVGVDWINAHENGHRTIMQLWRTEHIALWTEMPGETANIQMEQAAQCEASAAGFVQPWPWNDDEIAAGYWTCPSEYVALVAAA